MIRLTRPVTRETGERDQRTGRPIVLTLEQGGRLVRLRAKGCRKTYAVPIKEIWLLGARIAAQEIRQAKAVERERRRRKREA